MLLSRGIGEDSWESFGLQGDQTSPSYRKSTVNIHWKDWCWSWSSKSLATWCEEMTHWKSAWFWERLRAGGDGGSRRWDVWMASPAQWTWVWVNFKRQWRTGNPGKDFPYKLCFLMVIKREATRTNVGRLVGHLWDDSSNSRKMTVLNFYLLVAW